jgi:hypothetical protein
VGRPPGYQWQPLGLDADPVPGDPVRIGQEAAHLATVASQISGQVAALRKIGAGGADGALKGQYADKIHSSANDLAGQLDKVVGRYQKVSSALEGWRPDLEQAQSMSLQALDQAEGPYKKLNQTVVLPSGSNLTAQQKQDVQNYHNSMKAAQGELDAAKALLAKATSLRDSSASHHAGLINKAIDDSMKDSWWDSFTSWVGDVWGDFSHLIGKISWLIGDICTVLEVLATVAAIVAFVLAQFVPGVDVLVDTIVAAAFWGTLAAAGGRFLLASTGNGSWWDFAVDAFSCLTFGLGRFLGAGLKSVSAATQTVGKTMMATELSQEALGGAKALQVARYAALIGEDPAVTAERLGGKLIGGMGKEGEALTGLSKVWSSLGSLSAEGKAASRVVAIGTRFAGSAADNTALAKTLLTGMGASAGLAGLTGIGTLAGGGIELDGPGGPTAVNWHIPGVTQWYKSTFEVPTGGA